MPKVLVIYFSRTGNTERMAELVAEGARSRGVDVELVKAPDVDMEQVVRADGLALGSPDYYTYMAGQMKVFFDEAYFHSCKLKNKPYVSFVSHGGGGGAIDSIDRLSGSLGLSRVRAGLRCQGRPTGEMEEECRALGRDLADALSE